ncbi:MAG: transcription elongation factor GreB [Bdellovibrionaceae bacterium]|nr:transcription elongation factor GreB [Pseudobdellovibrionaceae bacterium]
MSSDKNYITPQGLKALKEEYSFLLNVERPKVVETVAWAASNGDRSENADYQYGKKRLREIDRRLHFLSGRIEKAEVVDPATVKSDKILFGATVVLSDEEGKEQTWQIVGEDEWDIKLGKISWKSPLARALLGKKVGDEITVQKPGGEETFVVEELRYG